MDWLRKKKAFCCTAARSRKPVLSTGKVRAKGKLALITGGDGGIGKELARILLDQGYQVVLVGRNEAHLQAAGAQLEEAGDRLILYPCDLSAKAECGRLLKDFRRQEPELVINCAGFGTYGDFIRTSLEREMTMLDVNGRAVHILMKGFLRDMVKRGHGSLLNVASSAGLAPGGPSMAAYYATKAYVVSLARGAAEELRAAGSPVYVGVFCPGPVKTDFFERTGLRAARYGLTPRAAAEAAVRGMERRQVVIIPGFANRVGSLASRFLPGQAVLSVNHHIQKSKRN